jgi:hypothetical protein
LLGAVDGGGGELDELLAGHCHGGRGDADGLVLLNETRGWQGQALP